MQTNPFQDSVLNILERDARYDAQAYFFLKESLDFTLKSILEENRENGRHVSGQELLAGFRDFAIEQFGPMATTLLSEWGIHEGQDVGNMVFLLIEERVFGRQDSDKPEDFNGVFDLHKELAKPFLPAKQLLSTEAL